MDTPTPSAVDMYEASHRHPVNRALHAIGIPLIACAGLATLIGPAVVGVQRRQALTAATAGVALLFLGHAIEGNRPVIFASSHAIPAALRWLRREVIQFCRRTIAQ